MYTHSSDKNGLYNLKRIGTTKEGMPLYTWDTNSVKIEFPNEFDFINAFFPKNPIGAREYFR